MCPMCREHDKRQREMNFCRVRVCGCARDRERIRDAFAQRKGVFASAMVETVAEVCLSEKQQAHLRKHNNITHKTCSLCATMVSLVSLARPRVCACAAARI